MFYPLRLFRIEEAACLLDISQRTLYRYIRTNRLAVITRTWFAGPMDGGRHRWIRVRYYIRGSELERFCLEHEARTRRRIELRQAKAFRTQADWRALWRAAKRRSRERDRQDPTRKLRRQEQGLYLRA